MISSEICPSTRYAFLCVGLILGSLSTHGSKKAPSCSILRSLQLCKPERKKNALFPQSSNRSPLFALCWVYITCTWHRWACVGWFSYHWSTGLKSSYWLGLGNMPTLLQSLWLEDEVLWLARPGPPLPGTVRRLVSQSKVQMLLPQ